MAARTVVDIHIAPPSGANERSPWVPSNGNYVQSVPPEVPQIVNVIYVAPSVSSG